MANPWANTPTALKDGCIVCLYRVGWGCKTIAKRLKCGIGRALRVTRSAGLNDGTRRPPISAIRKAVETRMAKPESINRRAAKEAERKAASAAREARPRKSAAEVKELSRAKSLAYYYATKDRPDKLAKKASPRWKEMKRRARKAWDARNPEKVREMVKRWAKANPEKVRDMRRKQKNKPENKLVANVRRRVRDIFKSTTETFRELCGCSAAELRKHIERQFKPWMTWGNYGTRWHIDHIVPLSYFDLTKPEERKRASHFANLRPLCAKKNIERGDDAGWQTPILL